MRRTSGAILLGISLCGCAVNTGVLPLGPDIFTVSKQAATGFSGRGTLKAEAIQEANQYCIANGKSMLVTNSNETLPPYGLGNYPRADINFMCLAAGDQRLKGDFQYDQKKL